MNVNSIKIAIDGGAATGKSSVAIKVAKKLNIIPINSGLFYRLIAIIAKENNLIDNEIELLKFIKKVTFDYSGEKITSSYKFDYSLIETEEIGTLASKISALESIRIFVTKKLSKIISNRENVIMEGRDIGTVVMPKANFKFYLTVSIDEAVKRRQDLFFKKNPDLTISDLRKEIVMRNKSDESRKFAPLVKPKDAITINTDNKTQNEVVEEILNHVQKS